MNYVDAIAHRIEQSLSPDLKPETDAVTLYRSYALLALVVGRDVTLENVHDAWSSWQAAIDPDHESIRPFSELDASTREKDRPYLDVIRQVAQRLSEAPK